MSSHPQHLIVIGTRDFHDDLTLTVRLHQARTLRPGSAAQLRGHVDLLRLERAACGHLFLPTTLIVRPELNAAGAADTAHLSGPDLQVVHCQYPHEFLRADVTVGGLLQDAGNGEAYVVFRNHDGRRLPVAHLPMPFIAP